MDVPLKAHTMDDGPGIAENVMAAACADVCEHMAIGVIVCDPQMSVLAVTPTARALLSEFGDDPTIGHPLLPALSEAARTYLRQAESIRGCARVAAIRIKTPNGLRTLHVVSKRLEYLLPFAAPVAVAVRLHEDRFADDKDLFDVLGGNFNLSSRDRRLIVLLREGRSNAEMAQVLRLTVGTLKVYLHELYKKFDVHSRWQLLALFERIRAER